MRVATRCALPAGIMLLLSSAAWSADRAHSAQAAADAPASPKPAPAQAAASSDTSSADKPAATAPASAPVETPEQITASSDQSAAGNAAAAPASAPAQAPPTAPAERAPAPPAEHAATPAATPATDRTTAPAATPPADPAAAPAPPTTMAAVLAASKPSDWRALDPENTLYIDLPAGRVVIALAPAFAPRHVANVKALVREGYFDGLAILRSQDNYVVQWGDPNGDDTAQRRPIQKAQRTLGAEFDRPASPDLPFTRLPDGDVYAPEVGFSDGFPAARDPKSGRAWLAHCYGMVGAGRDTGADTGGGTELYAVSGHAPRHLDRNVTLLGRVVSGMELLSALPRGSGPLGFYEKPGQRLALKSVRVAADLPAEARTALEVLRTDTPTFSALIESRRNRREEWFKAQAGHIELCNVPLVVRPRPQQGQ